MHKWPAACARRARKVKCSMDAGQGQENPHALWQWILARIGEHLHALLRMSPIGPRLRDACREYPSLVACCTVDFFAPWRETALSAVATARMEQVPRLVSKAWRAPMAGLGARRLDDIRRTAISAGLLRSEEMLGRMIPGISLVNMCRPSRRQKQGQHHSMRGDHRVLRV